MRKRKRRSFDLTQPVVPRPRMPLTIFLRMFLIGSVAVGASCYAIYRHFAFRPAPMLVPVTEPAAPDLVPVPEIVPLPAER